jgi:hypothetical protein
MTDPTFAPVAVSGSTHHDLGDGQRADFRDGRLVCFNLRDPHRYAEMAAFTQARLRFANRHARRTHMLELYRYATGSDPIPASIAEDVAAVRAAMERDEARRADVTQRAHAAVASTGTV